MKLQKSNAKIFFMSIILRKTNFRKYPKNQVISVKPHLNNPLSLSKSNNWLVVLS